MGDVRNSVQGSGPKSTPEPSVSSMGARLATIEAFLRGKKGKKNKDKFPDIPAYLSEGSLIAQVKGIKDEVSRLIEVKDKDTANEGDVARVDNVRKSEQLKSVYKMLTSAQNTLEDMY